MTDLPQAVLSERVAQRRTFAIISHPDAGKTTLTEKLLLFAGAIQIAGSVKARKASRHATSDWMEIEKQRGISVASSVMQIEYRDKVINLLDTPGHQDFSEDTYRVLTAVDSALMVIDAVNGVEEQTLRLLEVCRSRGTPIITFINKLDREVREPVDLIDEIERVLGMSAVPFSWPIGMGKSFHGVYDLREDCIRVFKPGEDRLAGKEEVIQGIDHPSLAARFGAAMQQARHDIELVRAATPEFSREEFLAGRQTPVFFGSAINNFGVKEVLDALVDIAPPPRPRIALQGPVAARSASASPAWCSRSRRTWTRPIAIAWCSCACARDTSSAACACASSAPARTSAPTTWCPSCPSAASCSTRPTPGTSSASPPTAACSSATPSPRASRCSSPGCRSSRRRSSASSRCSIRCAPSSCARG